MALALGESFFTLAWWGLGMCGLSFTFMSGVLAGSLIGLSLVLMMFRGRHGWAHKMPETQMRTTSWHALPLVLMVALGTSIFVFQAWMVFAQTTHCIPGMGIWGFKGKYLALAGQWHPELLTLSGYDFTQPGYPLHVPLLHTWLYNCMGVADDFALRLLNPIYSTLTALWLALWLHKRGAHSVVCLVSFVLAGLNWLPLEWCSNIYVEPLLAFHGLMALTLLSDSAGTGTVTWQTWTLLGSCAWIKIEGFPVWLIGGSLALIFMMKHLSGRSPLMMKTTRAWLALGAGFIVFWYGYRWCLGVHSKDFSLSVLLKETWGERILSCRKILGALALQTVHYGYYYMGAFWLAPLGLLSVWWQRSWRTGGSYLMVWSLIYCGVMSLSLLLSCHDMDWHFSALSRILWLPTLAAFAGATLAMTVTPNAPTFVRTSENK